VVCDPGEDVAEIFFGVDSFQLRRFDEGADCGGAHAPGIGAGEEVVLAAEGQGADGAFGGVVVDGKTAVIEEAGEFGPARERVADGLGEVGFAREFVAARDKPRPEGGKDRRRSRLPFGAALVRRAAADFLFDGVEFADARERLLGDLRFPRDADVEELPSRVRPAGGFENEALLVEFVEAGIAVRLQNALEGFEMGLAMLALAVFGVAVEGGGRRIA